MFWSFTFMFLFFSWRTCATASRLAINWFSKVKTLQRLFALLCLTYRTLETAIDAERGYVTTAVADFIVFMGRIGLSQLQKKRRVDSKLTWLHWHQPVSHLCFNLLRVVEVLWSIHNLNRSRNHCFFIAELILQSQSVPQRYASSSVFIAWWHNVFEID